MICLEQSFIQGAGMVSSSQKLSLATIWQLKTWYNSFINRLHIILNLKNK